MTEKEEAVFRSADMSLVQLYVPTEVARDIIYKVGQLDIIQFRDLNSKVNEFQRSFVKELRKLDNVERQFNLFKRELDFRDIPIKLFPYEFDKAPPQTEIDELLKVTTLNAREVYLKQFKYTIQAVNKFFALQGEGVVENEEAALLSQLESGGQLTLVQLRNSFIIFAHGTLIHERIKKICESLDAELYDVDSTSEARKEQLHDITTKASDLSVVLGESENALNSELIAISRDLAKWWEIIAREKAVYKAMNSCDYDGSRKTLVAEGWTPTDSITELTTTIQEYDASQSFRLLSMSWTPIRLHQHIKRYEKDEIFDMAYTGRYVLLLMGLFSMYTGFIYNDIFSRSMSLFKSGWEWPEKFTIGETLFAKKVGVYAIGLDPAWHGAENALLFSNSYKMKLSILMGYIHMTYSYMFSLANYTYFNSMIDIIGNFIPGLFFMQGIFGYLSLCIVYKWSVDWFATRRQPPGLLNMLINMFLAPGDVPEPLYSGQSTPLYLKRQLDREAKEHAQYSQLPNDDDEEAGPADGGHHDDDDEDHEEHGFGDIMIHQVIHTIEFCLNCVSHTASYLRLWALSLAHAQLSTVLWSMTIGNAFGPTGVVGVIMVVFLFAMWFTLSVCILVVMEGTSAMLHSLRLHWVESMSKYFEGGGSAFEPFTFRGLLDSVF
ncbi:V-type proton ATPase subunit a, vacuolar isoform [Candida viswanathii]|uniref:V-type proton ATPase subunit a n=1 Tax=Candida viswanathii TaxID=5486 RepID=A0A367XST1_9ASCO|nr:V-type proton ATPase subunit a, vacuolar isoform [Candida viswanathii]